MRRDEIVLTINVDCTKFNEALKEACKSFSRLDRMFFKAMLPKKYPNKMFCNMYKRKAETRRILGER